MSKYFLRYKVLSFLLIFTFFKAYLAYGSSSIWIEAETPSSVSKSMPENQENSKNIGYSMEGWGRRSMISGGNLLSINIASNKVDSIIPENGIVFGYTFNIEKSQNYDIWVRIGYESVRSDFKWRVDNGIWKTCTSQDPTINIQPIQAWNELAWLKLDQQMIKSGKHTIEFKHEKYKTKDKKTGKEITSRLLHMLDVVYITPESFFPCGKWQPGTEHKSKKDIEAEKMIYSIETTPSADGRAWTTLSGLWQYAAWDETEFPILESNRTEPTKELPVLDSLRWFAINIPGDRTKQLPQEEFSHRYLLRTKISIPQNNMGKSFILDVQRSSFIIGVFVNGKYVNGTKVFHTAWQIDLSAYVESGKENDLVLCVKDAYYSLNPKGMPDENRLGNRIFWNRPQERLGKYPGDAPYHDFPLAADIRSGILEPASIIVAGSQYTEDVFCKTSLKNKNISLEITVNNPNDNAVKAIIKNEIIPWNQGKGGNVQLTFSPIELTLDPKSHHQIDANQTWTNPRLWWPDSPYLYWVVTKIFIDDILIDVKKTRFGFREWEWDTHMFVLNGIKWPMWGDINYGKTPQEFVEKSKRYSHQNQVRYWRQGGWGDMTRRECLNYFDETGMLVRSSGTFDGQMGEYHHGLIEDDTSQPVNKSGKYPLKARTNFWNNWRDQMSAWVKEERNHASIYIWSVENEIAFINSQNMGQSEQCEPEIAKGVQHVMNCDPTRPAMIDGGNALRDESLPINGAHYTEFMNTEFRDYPDAAYTREHYYDRKSPQRGAWTMVPDRPIMMGEIYFADGYTKESFATIGGESCFIGNSGTMEARGLWAKILSEGYRWAEVSSFQFWMIKSDHSHWNSWSPVAVLCREWDWTWGENQKVERTIKVFNSTSNPDPIEVSWKWLVEGHELNGQTSLMTVPCGESQQLNISFSTPVIQHPSKGSFVMIASRNGKEVFRDEKPVSLICPMKIVLPKLKPNELFVFDPKGSVKKILNQRNILFTDFQEKDKSIDSAKVFIVGSDAINVDASTNDEWLKMAANGVKVIILDQNHPLVYNAIPSDLQPTSHNGRIGFMEDLTHPIFNGLNQNDFFTWSNSPIVYRNAYKKGTMGGRSLFQCDDSLSHTALFECQINDGILLLCQLDLGRRLGDGDVADQVFLNMLSYAINYKQIKKKTVCHFSKNDNRDKLLESIKLKSDHSISVADSLRDQMISIMDASPQNLKILNDNIERVQSFCEEGGWLMLWGLTPDGLSEFNQLTGIEHAIRKFDKERVLLTQPRYKLSSGITQKDVVLDTGKKMFKWKSLKEPDSDAYTWVVNDKDIAPFCKFPTPMEMGKNSNDNPGVDHFPRNMVNGFTSEDNWTFSYTILVDEGQSTRFSMVLPKKTRLSHLKIKPAKNFNTITKINVFLDDSASPIVGNFEEDQQNDIFEIKIGDQMASKITIEIAEWKQEGDQSIIGIDNLWLEINQEKSSIQNVESLLNVGTLMVYNKGKGGIFLNQLNIKDQELNQENIVKKCNIVQAILKNMGAAFIPREVGPKTQHYIYHPVRIADSTFNAFLDQKGIPAWYADGDIASMPLGNQTYDGIDFYLNDFSTSPVPSVIMLDGEGSNAPSHSKSDSIIVDNKASTLSFLHTYQPGSGISRWRASILKAEYKNLPLPEPLHVMSYIVHYEGGKKEEVKIYFEKEIGDWANQNPLPLPNANLVWIGKQQSGNPSSVWAMTWKNPFPDILVKSIEIVQRGSKSFGSGAIFAISRGVDP